jgi:hypothetical protein
MQFTETSFPGNLTILHLFDTGVSATMELHSTYYTYYWPSRLDPNRFLAHTFNKVSNLNSVTVIDDTQGLRKLPYPGEDKPILKWLQVAFRLGSLAETVSLIRLDETERSWVWQCVPGQSASQNETAELTGAFRKDGLVAYEGCASVDNHMRNFERANRVLVESAAGDPRSILEYTDLFERYLTRWVRR